MSLHQRKKNWLRWGLASLVLMLVVGCIGLTLFGAGRSMPSPMENVEASGTIFTPTLDGPIVPGGNTVYCASFQAAWKTIQDIDSPLTVEEPDPWITRLNDAKDPWQSIPREFLHINTGISTQLPKPDLGSQKSNSLRATPIPDQEHLPKSTILGYAFLKTRARFQKPFLENEHPMVLQAASGKRAAIRSFGVWNRSDQAKALRNQVRMVYVSADAKSRVTESILEFALTSDRQRLVIAFVAPQATLRQTVDDVQRKIKSTGMSGPSLAGWAGEPFVLPEVQLTARHRFSELDGAVFTNKKIVGKTLAARQSVEFLLDRQGAQLVSLCPVGKVDEPIEPGVALAQPFLIFLQKPGGRVPFFAMWVGNSSVLRSWR